MSNTILEYVWLGANNELRSKTKVVSGEMSLVAEMPLWSFDGSSTEQAPGNHSDCILKPVKAYPNPFHVMTVNDYYLVMCEVVDDEHNKRALIKSDSHTYWFGFEQEYFIYRHGRPLGWPASSDAMPQGPYYCGVGAENVAGRTFVDEHMQACMHDLRGRSLQARAGGAEVAPKSRGNYFVRISQSQVLLLIKMSHAFSRILGSVFFLSHLPFSSPCKLVNC